MSNNQITFALIKPDAIQYQQEIIKRIEKEGFNIYVNKEILFTKAEASLFYEEHKEKPFFTKLVEFMSSGPSIVMILCAPNAILKWRNLIGPTDTEKAKTEAPNSLRAQYGTGGVQNGFHGSDSPQSANREMMFYDDICVQRIIQ